MNEALDEIEITWNVQKCVPFFVGGTLMTLKKSLQMNLPSSGTVLIQFKAGDELIYLYRHWDYRYFKWNGDIYEAPASWLDSYFDRTEYNARVDMIVRKIMDNRKNIKPCGNRNCGISTGIHEGLSFGSGKLDECGYWQFPCRECAKNWDKNERPKALKEEKEKILKEFPKFTEIEAINYLKSNHEYLFIRAWPYEEEKQNAKS